MPKIWNISKTIDDKRGCSFPLIFLGTDAMTIYLSKHDVMYINQNILQQHGIQSHLINEHALDSTLMRPQAAFYYQQADIITQGALLIAGIALAHAFLDGNKRTALIAGYDFFKINNYQMSVAPLEFAYQIEAILIRQTHLDVVMQEFIVWLRSHIQ